MKTLNKKSPLFIGAIVIIALFILVAIVGCDDEGSKDKLSFKVTSTESISKDKNIQVLMTGKTSSGEEVTKTFDAKLDTSYKVNYGKGEYTFQVKTSSVDTDTNVYKSNEEKVKYDGKTDKEVTLKIELDTDATKRKQEQQKIDAEKKAQEQAAAAAKQQQQAQQQTQQPAESSSTWFLVKTTGTFHRSESCSAYKRSKVANRTTIQGTRSGLEAQGYHACQICN